MTTEVTTRPATNLKQMLETFSDEEIADFFTNFYEEIAKKPMPESFAALSPEVKRERMNKALDFMITRYNQ